MKERPILFFAPMVRAILDGTKTQTRRIMKPQPTVSEDGWFSWNGHAPNSPYGAYATNHIDKESLRLFVGPSSPYGKPGDRLWVRESWQCLLEAHNCKVGYAATPDNWKNIDLEMLTQEQDEQAWHWAKKVGCAPSIHMPRWASRILLEIVGVRVERLNDISEEDAKAEGLKYHSLYREWGGVEPHPASSISLPQWRWYETPKKAFSNLWESINDKGSWDANPWVWVVEFKRIEPGAA